MSHARVKAQGKGFFQFARTVLLSLITLSAVMLVHYATHFSPAMLPLYVIPIWLAVQLDGVRSGAPFVFLSGAGMAFAESYRDQRAGIETPLLIGVVLSLGLIMMLMAWVDNQLRRTRRQAMEDPLTGLMNRRGFYELAEQAYEEAADRNVVVVAIDCDNFKALNDQFGHEAGDTMLRLLARVMHANTRETDILARVGGDEFVLLLSGVRRYDARRIVKRIESEFTEEAGRAGYRCSITAGFAEPTKPGLTLDALLRRADKAMFVRKDLKRAQAFLN